MSTKLGNVANIDISGLTLLENKKLFFVNNGFTLSLYVDQDSDNDILFPNKSGVIALVDDIYILESTGTEIHFDRRREYGTATASESSDFTSDFTESKKGIVQKIYHNNSSEPTFPISWVKLQGDYEINELNIIYAVWAGDVRVEYWIIKG